MKSAALKGLAEELCSKSIMFQRQQQQEYLAGPAETTLVAYIRTLCDILKFGTIGDKDEAWFSDAMRYWKINSACEPSDAAPFFVEKLIMSFSDEFSVWLYNKYGKENFVYVANAYDKEAIDQIIVPYLRIRSNKKSALALEVWHEIISNFFASNLPKWDHKPPSIKEMAQNLRELEIQPLGPANKPVLYGDEKTVVDAFLAIKPNGFYSARDAKALLDISDNVQDAIEGINWMFSDDVTDDFLRENRPFTLGFITRMWNHYQAYKQHKPNPAKQEEAMRQLRGKLSKIV